MLLEKKHKTKNKKSGIEVSGFGKEASIQVGVLSSRIAFRKYSSIRDM